MQSSSCSAIKQSKICQLVIFSPGLLHRNLELGMEIQSCPQSSQWTEMGQPHWHLSGMDSVDWTNKIQGISYCCFGGILIEYFYQYHGG